MEMRDPARALTGRDVAVIPLLAAMVMTSWDLAVDPTLSTLGRYWIWRDGGAWFGVPVSNFGGWLATNYLIYQCFALYQGRRSFAGAAPTMFYWRLPVIFMPRSPRAMPREPFPFRDRRVLPDHSS